MATLLFAQMQCLAVCVRACVCVRRRKRGEMRVLSCKLLGRVVISALPQQIISQRSLSRTAAAMVKVSGGHRKTPISICRSTRGALHKPVGQTA